MEELDWRCIPVEHRIGVIVAVCICVLVPVCLPKYLVNMAEYIIYFILLPINLVWVAICFFWAMFQKGKKE